MGGVLARFAIGILDRQNSYTSFASPHLGIHLAHDAWYLKLAYGMIKRAGCPTTEQVTFSDSFRDGKPIFEVLADPAYEFYKALSKFKYKRSYVNTMHDSSVAYYTSAMDPFDYFDDDSNLTMSMHWHNHEQIILKFKDYKDGYYKIHIDKDKDKFLFREDQQESEEVAEQKSGHIDVYGSQIGPNLKGRTELQLKCLPVQQKMIDNLKEIPWERVLVRIDSILSHLAIMGMGFSSQEGRDVVKHFIDTFDM
ncbi:hypothetical protein G6F46_008422 [Rhizopus delemar]|uniref:DUF676 domain-containing protein n=2 Tax=Rhizopus TaxID=4842 RepID=A0A9P6ZCZ2_9FUNG|nr:hypothetical protein G6F55_007270 [Rhizopus delemar]KAG1551067.1 hypothetical protein G6F51_002067 [Rhizopus arrhizus]KAG1494239.1 hypothetical protein G6F54_008018 [Rhizopus delemar]KAG1517747.1 hypothetical protein G6F53_001122 [Rhizopus delemar]KAG1520839.1 hypothetical protein G6F52_007294 [Rhizopus delemar]